MSDPESEPYEPKASVEELSEQAKKTPEVSKRAWWSTPVKVLTVATLLIVGLQVFAAPVFDHQYTNFGCYAIGLLALGYMLIAFHLHSRRQNKPWKAPAVVAAVSLAFIMLFQFDGFSGEMFPQFKFRLSTKQHELKNVEPANEQDVDLLPISETANAIDDSPGFLGQDRNAVIAERKFSVPKNINDIQVLWDQGIGAGWASFAVKDDRAITLEQRDDFECVTCYRLGDGKLLWKNSTKAYHYNPLGGAGPRSTPIIVGDRVYAAGATGHVWCLNLVTGEEIWHVDLLKMANWEQAECETAVTWGRSISPLIVDDICVVGFGTKVDINNPEVGDRSLIALNCKNGGIRWTSGSDQISYASPALLNLGGRRQIVSVNEKTVTGHEVSNGKILWSMDWPGGSNSNANCSMVVQAGKDRFLVGKGYGGGSSLVEVTPNGDGFEVEEVWHSGRVLKTKFTHACVSGDIAYALNDGSLQAVQVEDGDRLWMQPRSSRFGQGQILLVEDMIVGQAEGGDVVFVPASTAGYEEKFRWPALSSKTWNVPTVAGRHLLIRNDRQAICVLLPERR